MVNALAKSGDVEPSQIYPAIVCSVCGVRAPIERGDHPSTRESYSCSNCNTSLRYRDQATLILDEFGRGRFLSIDKMARDGGLDKVDIFEPALGGPFVRHFGRLPGYKQSYYWDDLVPAEERGGVPFQDLSKLTFSDSSFDLVITSDVFEHIFDPLSAFKEVARVLKVGGVHIFSIPTDWPLPKVSVTRAEKRRGKVVHHHEKRFHRAGDGSQTLVVTDFGEDLIEMLEPMGLKTQIVRRSLPLDECYRNATFISRRLF